ncbi:hypothetical protein, variant [Puccinia triticina 1-1 BBBD Race 1]|uniref:Uncharacterized protein n=2 Tax=Puccinia triticina TaxID=208348 RepID=A0A180GSC4_PUCT1|nr:hypothetical protein PTTG_04378 [Puccinia triticina 1-1 BBBD Race 1]OAV95202.1 hypothetical protein, variant [Puccinia triticina 1-1 BBBD Race 1]
MASKDAGSSVAEVRLCLRLDMSTRSDGSAGEPKKHESELVERVASGGLSELAKSLARLRAQSNQTLTALINSYGAAETGKEKRVSEKLQAALAARSEPDDEDDEGDELEADED